MGRAKDIVVKPISAASANKVVRALHYSGKVVPNSQVHLGVFLDGKCGGAMQLGPSMRKDLIAPLVSGTGWNEFIELNRMAFADWLPRNSESRCIGYAMRWLKRRYQHLKWVVSFADGTQCGDGAIYRASGFVLTGIKKNNGMRINPRTGEVVQNMTAFHRCITDFHKWKPLPGYQFRYLYFLDPSAFQRLTVPVIPFSEIGARGAEMYKGEKITRPKHCVDAPDDQSGEGGSTPTRTLQT